MWKSVGILRSETSLQNAIVSWQKWVDVLERPPLNRLALETGNMLWTAAALIESALARRESLGAHFREDFPEMEQTYPPKHSHLNRLTLAKYFPPLRVQTS